MPIQFSNPTSMYHDRGSRQIADTLQQRFAQNFANADQLDLTMDALQPAPFEGDEAIYNDLRTSTRTALEGFADRGDYENFTIPLQKELTRFTKVASALNKNKEQLASMKGTLDTMYEKGDIDSETYQNYMGYATHGYKGLTQDENGAYDNFFSPSTPSKYVDILTSVKDDLAGLISEDMVGSDIDHIVEDPLYGLQIITTGGETHTISQEKVMAVLNGRLADPNVQAYLNQTVAMRTYNVSPEDAMSYMGEYSTMYQSYIQQLQAEKAKEKKTSKVLAIDEEIKKAALELSNYNRILQSGDTDVAIAKLQELEKEKIISPIRDAALAKTKTKTTTKYKINMDLSFYNDKLKLRDELASIPPEVNLGSLSTIANMSIIDSREEVTNLTNSELEQRENLEEAFGITLSDMNAAQNLPTVSEMRALVEAKQAEEPDANQQAILDRYQNDPIANHLASKFIGEGATSLSVYEDMRHNYSITATDLHNKQTSYNEIAKGFKKEYEKEVNSRLSGKAGDTPADKQLDTYYNFLESYGINDPAIVAASLERAKETHPTLNPRQLFTIAMEELTGEDATNQEWSLGNKTVRMNQFEYHLYSQMSRPMNDDETGLGKKTAAFLFSGALTGWDESVDNLERDEAIIGASEMMNQFSSRNGLFHALVYAGADATKNFEAKWNKKHAVRTTSEIFGTTTIGTKEENAQINAAVKLGSKNYNIPIVLQVDGAPLDTYATTNPVTLNNLMQVDRRLQVLGDQFAIDVSTDEGKQALANGLGMRLEDLLAPEWYVKLGSAEPIYNVALPKEGNFIGLDYVITPSLEHAKPVNLRVYAESKDLIKNKNLNRLLSSPATKLNHTVNKIHVSNPDYDFPGATNVRTIDYPIDDLLNGVNNPSQVLGLMQKNGVSNGMGGVPTKIHVLLNKKDWKASNFITLGDNKTQVQLNTTITKDMLASKDYVVVESNNGTEKVYNLMKLDDIVGGLKATEADLQIFKMR